MITVRRSKERGHFNHGWLETYHTFSFGEYFDRHNMAFRSLRVINEDFVEPGEGFPTHPHKDMEIITYVLSGALAHKDSLGSEEVIYPGNVQKLSAGTGITHSEYNASQTEKVHLLQIWILPERKGFKPMYQEKEFAKELSPGKLVLVGSHEGEKGGVTIHQDVSLYVGRPDANSPMILPLKKERFGWIQVTKGSLTVGDVTLSAGDGASIAEEENLSVVGENGGEFLYFDLA